jgi:hypothetical protein
VVEVRLGGLLIVLLKRHEIHGVCSGAILTCCNNDHRDGGMEGYGIPVVI